MRLNSMHPKSAALAVGQDVVVRHLGAKQSLAEEQDRRPLFLETLIFVSARSPQLAARSRYWQTNTQPAGKMLPRPLLPYWVVLALLRGLGGSWAILTTPAGAVRRAAGASNVAAGLHRSPLSMTAGSPTVKEGAVIVGGGPSGLATALMLAKRGWTDISILERTPSADLFDPLKAFV